MGSLLDNDGVVRETGIDSLVLLADNVSVAQRDKVVAALEHCLNDGNTRVAAKARDALDRSYRIQSESQIQGDSCCVRYDEHSQLIAAEAQLQELYADDIFFEGPSWDPGTEKLYFVAWGTPKQFLRLG